MRRREVLGLFGGGLLAMGARCTDSPELGPPPDPVFPGDQWSWISPAQAGFDAGRFRKLLGQAQPRGASFGGKQYEGNQWGAVLGRGGYLIHAWGDPDYRDHTASVGKAFTRAVVGLAVDEGLIQPDDRIAATWTGEGQLSHPEKYLHRGYHQQLTWRHLLDHTGGFPVTNGYQWRRAAGGRTVPRWARWTGDPLRDNYAHAEPGAQRQYSSGGYWRLSQALTALWGQDLKKLLDERLFRHMGIPAERWDWLPGKFVHGKADFYPAMPGYGDFVDPPYEIEGQLVRGGGGWVVMSAQDLARWGLLVATGGMWAGQRLISAPWIQGHSGANGSLVAADPRAGLVLAVVTATELPRLASFRDAIAGPVMVAETP